jgi:hypothetical protein
VRGRAFYARSSRNCLPGTDPRCSFAMLRAWSRETPRKSWESVLALSRPAYSALGELRLAEYAPGFVLPFKVCQSIRTPAPSLILGLRSEWQELPLTIGNPRKRRGFFQRTRGRVKESKF